PSPAPGPRGRAGAAAAARSPRPDSGAALAPTGRRGVGWGPTAQGHPREGTEMTEDSKARRTPEERAIEEFDLATRGVEKARARAERLAADAEKAQADLRRAEYRARVAAEHPDLPGDRRPAADDGGDLLN